MIEAAYLVFGWILPGCAAMLVSDCISSGTWKRPTQEELLAALIIGGFIGLIGVVATLWMAGHTLVERLRRS